MVDVVLDDEAAAVRECGCLADADGAVLWGCDEHEATPRAQWRDPLRVTRVLSAICRGCGAQLAGEDGALSFSRCRCGEDLEL